MKYLIKLRHPTIDDVAKPVTLLIKAIFFLLLLQDHPMTNIKIIYLIFSGITSVQELIYVSDNFILFTKVNDKSCHEAYYEMFWGNVCFIIIFVSKAYAWYMIFFSCQAKLSFNAKHHKIPVSNCMHDTHHKSLNIIQIIPYWIFKCIETFISFNCIFI